MTTTCLCGTGFSKPLVRFINLIVTRFLITPPIDHSIRLGIPEQFLSYQTKYVDYGGWIAGFN
jgi:hypothetical protein